MAEEFQAGVCGSTWWNSPMSSLGLSPCSVAINNDHMGSFGWPSHDLVVDMNIKGRSSSTTTTTTTTDESGSVSHDGSMVMFQETQKPLHQQEDSGGRVLMDSNLQMMGIGFSSSSSTTDWNQTLLSGGGGGGGSGRSESNYQSSILQEDMNSRLNFRQEAGMEWSNMKNFSVIDGQKSSVVNGSKLTNPGFPLSEPCLNPATNSMMTCQGLATSFPMSSATYGYPSTLLQTLFDTTDPQPQPSLFEDRSMNYPSTTNYKTNLNVFSPSMAQLSPLLRPKQQTNASLHLTNTSTPFWNASTAALNDIQASFFPSTPTFEEKPSCPNFTAKRNNVQHLGSMVKKSSSEPAFKRPRIETPSPLPTFKVRKEKLGDRITALQQLVSPFGKTDTASVLQEAIEYIKFLHDQVSVLSTPYMKNGTPIQHQQTSDKPNDSEATKQDLRSRGLCLVPISSTFPVANETTVDFWTPTFGGTFR